MSMSSQPKEMFLTTSKPYQNQKKQLAYFFLPFRLQVQAVGGPQEYANLLEVTVRKLVGQTLGTQERKMGKPRTDFCPGLYELEEFFLKTSPHQGAYLLISA